LKIVIVFRIPLYCSITSFCEWLRMLGWRGFTNPRPKIAKFKKLRSSFCVLQSRITDYKKHFTIFRQTWFRWSGFISDHEITGFTQTLLMFPEYRSILRLQFSSYNFQADFSMQKNSPAPGVTLLRPIRQQIFWEEIMKFCTTILKRWKFLNVIFLRDWK